MREGWTSTPLGALLALKRRAERIEPEAEYKQLTIAINGNGVRLRKVVAGRDLGTAKFVCRSGDLMVSKIDARKGACAVLPPELDGAVVTSDFLSFEVNPELVESTFLDLWVKRPAFAELCDTISSGTTNRVRMDVGRFPFLELPLPPLRVQGRIVDLIDALDDALRECADAAVRLELLWWRIADDLRVSVAGLPVKRLGEVADIGGGLTKNGKDAEHPGAVQAPYLRVANVLRRRLDLRDIAVITAPKNRIEAARLMPGDVLMNEGGDKDKLGRGAVWRGAVKDCTHQNHVFRVRVRDDRFSPDFLSAWANSFGQKWFETHGTQTTGIASINKSTLGRFPVPDIDLSEQQRWAELLQGVTDQEDEYRAQARRLQRLRSSLLDVLLSGEHEIPESYDVLMGVAS